MSITNEKIYNLSIEYSRLLDSIQYNEMWWTHQEKEIKRMEVRILIKKFEIEDSAETISQIEKKHESLENLQFLLETRINTTMEDIVNLFETIYVILI